MTEEQARDEMFDMLDAEWTTKAGAVTGGAAPLIIWQGEEPETPPSREAGPYARATVRHFTGGQATLGSVGSRRFNREGAIFVQCFAPLGIGNPLTIAERLGRIARDAFEGRSSPGGIWFRNPRLNEVGPADGWFQVNVVAPFTYDEVK